MVPPGVFVHERGLCESVDVGAGTRVWAFAHILPGAQVGRDCNIGDGAFIEGGARLGDRVTVKNAVLVWAGVEVGDDVFLGPAVVFTNDLWPRAHDRKSPDELMGTRVGTGATVGANATIVCGTTIGHDAFIGAGAVVVADVASHALIVGNPARRVGWVCRCASRLDDDLVCGCGSHYRLVSEGSGLQLVDPADQAVVPVAFGSSQVV